MALAPKPGFTFTPTPPPEALRYLRNKGWQVGFDYRDVWRDEHAAAFTVAKAMTMDVLTSIRDEVTRALEEGRPFAQFKKYLQPTLEKLGWWGVQNVVDPKTGETVQAQLGSPRRLKVIYRANLRTARAAGQWERIERTAATHPYLRYELGPSLEHRKQHVAWAGTLLPVDHPWWNAHMPPNGWGCKCRVRQISKPESARLGGPTQPPPVKFRNWKNTRTGQVEKVPAGIDPGWDTNPGKLRMLELAKQAAEKAEAAQLAQADPIPLLTEHVVIGKQLANATGTNPGGLYQGRDGQKRYVKRYEVPTQSYVEAVTHRIYRELGLDAPAPALVVTQDKLAIAAGQVAGEQLGKAGLTPERAKQLLEGFTADVWLANWDVLGANLDNVLVDGQRLIRIDNGGALLFRAKSGRKPEDRLKSLSEWDGFADPSRNPSYAKVFAAAGLSGPDELGKGALAQIEAIVALGKRTRNFEDLLPPIAGVPEKDRLATLEALRGRAKLLESKIVPRVKEFLEAPPYERALRAALGSRYAGLLQSGLSRIRQAGGDRKDLRDAEVVALHAYTGNDYRELNEALRGESNEETLRRKLALAEGIRRALGKLPDETGWVNRGTSLPKPVLALHQVGNTVTYPAFTSASTGHGFSGAQRFKIKAKHAKDVRFISAFPNEDEVLFTAGTRFKVIARKDSGLTSQITLMEVDDDGGDFFPP